jgi:chorismate mutase/prephenate dehydratase
VKQIDGMKQRSSSPPHQITRKERIFPLGILDELRNEIDALDDKLVELLERRMEIVEEIGNVKIANGLKVHDPSREKKLLDRLSQQVGHPEYQTRILSIMKSILASSRALQSSLSQEPLVVSDGLKPHLKAGYAGIPGSYGEHATQRYFGRLDQDYMAYATFHDVADAVLSGEIDYGVLPAENTTTGAINEVYDLIREKDLYIVGEALVPIVHHLIGHPGVLPEEVHEIRSHPQGLEQCTLFLNKLKARQIPMKNTAVSVRHVAESGDRAIAAIGSERAAKLYGLEILTSAIQDSAVNTTRFVILSKSPEAASDADSTSMVLSTRHTSGSLYDILGYFASKEINLFRIESRPVPDRPWEYFIYLDAEGQPDSEAFQYAMTAARDHCPYFKFLGTYKRGVI